MFALVGMSSLYSSFPPPPPGPAGPPASGSYSQSRRQNANQPVEDSMFTPELNASVATFVDAGDKLVGNYANSATTIVQNVVGRKRKSNEFKADEAMLNNSAQVGDDSVDLLQARDKEDWKAFIDKQFQENPKALVETLVPLYQFNPEDVRELSQYIANRRDALGVRSIVQSTANTTDWIGAQEGMEQVEGAESFANSPEAKKIRSEFKGHLTKAAQKEGNKLLKSAQKSAEKASESYWNKIRNNIFGN